MTMPSSLIEVSRSAQVWASICSDNWRSIQFRTSDLFPQIEKCEYDRVFGSSTFSDGEAKSIVFQVIENRSTLTQDKLNNVNLDGRVLCHNFRETTYSCTAKLETAGFFDTLDIPPWDLWISMTGETSYEVLLSWVPQQLVELVDKGIKSSAEENIFWAKDGDLTGLE